MDKVNLFHGGMDSVSYLLNRGDYLDAFNLEGFNTGSENGGVLQRIDGNQSIAFSGIWTAPDGINRCIGAVSNNNGNTITFWWNSNGNHFICTDNEILRVSPLFNFSGVGLITHATVVDKEHLIWTDWSENSPNNSNNNPVRLLNLRKTSFKSSLTTKVVPSTYEDDFEFSINSAVRVDFVEIATGVSSPNFIVVDGAATGGGLEGSMRWLEGKLNAILPANSTAAYCDDKTIDIITDLTSSPEYYFDFSNLTTNSVFAYPVDFHRNDLSEYSLNLYPLSPSCEPNVIFDSKYKAGKGLYQFRCRYVYQDGRKSAWSGVSLTAYRKTHNFQFEVQSKIRVGLGDDRLADVDFRGELKRVEFAVREGDNGVWKNFEAKDSAHLGDGSDVFATFQEGKIYPVVASDDLTTSEGQNLKLHDSLPIIAKTVESVSDSTGNTRLIIGGGQEGYKLPCIDVLAEPQYDSVGLDDMVLIEGVVNLVSVTGHSNAPDFDKYNGGFPVYLTGTPFYGISDNPSNGSGSSGEFSFYAPKGKYIMRVASWKCRFDDENGSVYNLTNGIGWQETSSPVVGFNSFNISEWIIDTTSNTTGVYNVGTIEIHNQHYRDEGINFLSGYVKDDFGNWEESKNRNEAVGMPIQRVSTAATGVGVTSWTTDHNGYFLLCYEKGSTRFEIADLEVEIAFNQTTQNLTFMDFEGDENSVKLGTDIKIQGNLAGGSYDPTYTNGYVNLYADLWSQTGQMRKVITGSVFDTALNPARNTAIVLGFGGVARVNNDGNYSITAFTPVTPTNTGVLTVNLYGFAQYDLSANSSFVSNPLPTSTMAWGDNTLSGQDFTLNGFVIGTFRRYLKTGGAYRVGIGYVDKFGRKTPVLPIDTVEFGWHTLFGDLVKSYIKLTIKHLPPEWADKYIIYRSKNGKQRNYSQLRLSDVRYVNIPGDGEVMDSSTVPSHILIRIQSSEILNSDDGIVLFGNSDERVGYAIQEGDTVRPMLHQGGFLYQGDYELDIKGEYLDTNEGGKKWYIVENVIGEKIKAGDLVEISTPSKIENEFFFEDSCHDISTINNTKYHKGVVNQTPTSDAEVYIEGGDTYWRYRNYLNDVFVSSLPVENKNLSDVFSSSVEDIGFPNIEDRDYDETVRNNVRFSGLYLGSGKNGLGSFGVFDYINIGSENGDIQGLKSVNNTLLAVGARDSQPIYVGKSALLDLSGNSQVGRSTSVLNVANNTIIQHGTLNPESIQVADGTLYCFDTRRQRFWSYGSNGVQWLNREYDNAIRKKTADAFRIIGCVDKDKDVYKVMISPYAGDLEYNSEVLNYEFNQNKWKFREEFKSNYVWWDERRGIRTDYNNLMWNHYVSGVDSLYGFNITSFVLFKTEGLSGDLFFKNLLVNANEMPYYGHFQINPSHRNPLTQEAEALRFHWKDTRNKISCNIPRNLNDRRYNLTNTAAELANASVKGNILHGETMIVKIMFDSKVVLINTIVDTVEFIKT